MSIVKKLFLVWIVQTVLIIIVCFILFSNRYDSIHDIDVMDYSEEFEFANVFNKEYELMHDYKDELEHRGVGYGSWYEVGIYEHFQKTVIVSIVEKQDGSFGILIIPRSKRYDVVYLSEIDMPMPSRVDQELDILNENHEDTILSGYDLETYTYRIEVASRDQMFVNIPDDFQFATLYMIKVGKNDSTNNFLFLVIGTEGKYGIVEMDEDADYELYFLHQFE